MITLRGFRPQFYTQEEVSLFLRNVIHFQYQAVISVNEIWSELPNMGFKILSSSNNSLSVVYYGMKIQVNVSFKVLRSKLPNGLLILPE